MAQWRTLRPELERIPLKSRKSLCAEFAAMHTRWSLVTLNVVHDVFVNLLTQKEASMKYQIYKQTVNRAVKVFVAFLKAKKIIKK